MFDTVNKECYDEYVARIIANKFYFGEFIHDKGTVSGSIIKGFWLYL